MSQEEDKLKGDAGSPRRDFLKKVATAAAVGPTMAPAAGASSSATEAGASSAASSGSHAVTFPRRFEGAGLATIAFPLGGVGAGSISLGGRGQLRDWEIFNRPDKGNSPEYAFAAIWAQTPGSKPVARILEARIAPPYEGSSGLGAANVPGLPRLESAVFTGEFPLASVDFTDDKLPVKVRLEAFNPLIPLDGDATGLPIATLRYRVRNPGRREAKVSIAFSVSNPVGKSGRGGDPGRRNAYREDRGLKGIYMDNPFLDGQDPLKGTFALCVLGESAEVTHLTGWRGGSRWRVAPLAFWDDFSEDGQLDQSRHQIPQAVGSMCASQSVPAGAEKTFTFLLAWHFPNRTPARCGWAFRRSEAPEGEADTVIGNYYCQRFGDAWQAAQHAAGKLEELEAGTRSFVETMKRTSLPPAVVDASMSNLSTLHTNTCFRTADGHFHGFEGCNDHAGCCFGSCTHVWNYESLLAFLFPEFSRSLREYEFGWIVDDRGLQDFRYYLPYGKKRWATAAADGQMGTLMKLYLDWKLSGDTEWLRGLWPNAKRALEFAWIENGWDADRDGVMEGCQHNTYDIEFYGPNPLSGIWYLGGLRAGEEMARAVGDDTAAAEYRRLMDDGSKWIDDNLFNGEFYVQKVQGRPSSAIAKGLTAGMGAANSENPDFQMGEGCLADQVLGQYFAHIAGLGDLVNGGHARKALASIHKYNFKRDLSEHESVQRTYALNDEAGLLICDYAGRPRPENPFPYYAEVWTGIEYQVAAHMFYEGMIEEGLEIVEAVRQRHDGVRRNPWDEPECGHHYARALAAWSCVLALCGFHYAAPDQSVTLRPQMKEKDFHGFWSMPTGWGPFSQIATPEAVEILVEARRGEMACRRLNLASLGRSFKSVRVELAGNPVPAKLATTGGDVTVSLERSTKITPQVSLRVRLA